MPRTYLKYCAIRDIMFGDTFPTHSPLSTTNWEVVSGEFDAIKGKLTVIQPGEIAFRGYPLRTNGAISVKFVCVAGMKLEIRCRRSDKLNYVSFKLDFKNKIISLSETISGVENVLKTQTHLLSDDPVLYYVGLWCQDDVLMGFINGSYIIDAVSKHNLNQYKFSIVVPEIVEDTKTEFYCVTAHRIESFPTVPVNQVVDPDDIPTKFRLQLKDILENPPDTSYNTFVKARKRWESGKDFGQKDILWARAGYPLYEPLPEEWFKKV